MGEGAGGFKGFIIGQELMPYIFGMPLKFFWLRPSMMLWALLNLSLLGTYSLSYVTVIRRDANLHIMIKLIITFLANEAKHFELVGHISTAMLLYQLFSLFYIVDYFYHEEFMTSTWDIIAEK